MEEREYLNGIRSALDVTPDYYYDALASWHLELSSCT